MSRRTIGDVSFWDIFREFEDRKEANNMIDIARETVLKALYKIDKEEAYSNIALDEIIKENKHKLDDRDIGFISEIVYGVTSWKLTLDEIIKKYSKIRLKKISPWILNILRMGIYQIVFLDKVPKSAAVNEGVNLAKRYGHKSSSNFVNAILRKVDKKDYEAFFQIENAVERISKTTAMPEWIVKHLLKENSIDRVEEICKNSNMKPKISIRINSLKTNKKALENLLKERNIDFQEAKLEDFLILDKVKNIEGLDLFQKGYFTIQDEGAGLIAYALKAKPHEKVLDACSSPGGKTTYLAEMMENKGEIQAWDLHQHRVNLVEENAKRLGINIIQAKCQDASEYKEEYKEKFDKILLDVPCLGIGVLKRKPDIKWRRKEEDIKEITKIQKSILETCSKYLKEKGEMVYATCSIFSEENQKIVEEFLQKNSNFQQIKIPIKAFEKNMDKKGNIQLFQGIETDGFFICKLQKK